MHRLVACSMNTNQVRICIPVCERVLNELAQAITRAARAAEIIEIRLDCLADPEFELRQIAALVRSLEQPVIMTFRPAEQGGQRDADYPSRLQFWNTYRHLFTEEFLDIELDLAQGFASTPLLDWNRVICSHHDFAGVPADIKQVYERMAHTPAGVLKIAVQANDITDCIPLFHLLDRARNEGREMIAIAIGWAGIATRILGPSRGAFLTYGALEADKATAPGQVTAKELRDLYRIQRITYDTEIIGLVGLPVTHSFSPHIHNAAFEAAGVNAVYIPFEVRDLTAFIKRMAHPRTRELDWNLRGLSVTAPHKSAVIDYLDWIEPSAKEIGAVNTIVIEDQAMHGYNTDATAALKPVIERLGQIRDARCALIGAGGAASAVLWSLKNEGVKTTLFARDQGKGNALAEKFGAGCELLDRARFRDFDFVINATTLGTRGPFERETAATAVQLRGARLAYDLVYNPCETQFLREAREAGCDTIGGLTMLVLQAVEQFRLWTGAESPTEVMRAAAGRAVSATTEMANCE